MPFYSVANGRETGIYKTWGECEMQVKGFKNAIFKKFSSKSEAEIFIAERKENILDNGKILKTASTGSRKRKLSEIVESTKKTKIDEKPNCKFTVNEDGFLVVYTDGSCLSNGRNGSKAGIGVYFGKNSPLNVSKPAIGGATNNIAEIQAAISALEVAKSNNFDKVLINTDSNFMIKSVTQWMNSWKRKNWKKSDGKDVVNKVDFLKLNKVSAGMMIKWNHVNAHIGISGNEAADKLAKEGAKSYIAPV